jgi:hypothetical protein
VFGLCHGSNHGSGNGSGHGSDPKNDWNILGIAGVGVDLM